MHLKLFPKFVLAFLLISVVPLALGGFLLIRLNHRIAERMINLNQETLQGSILELHTHLASSLADRIDQYVNNLKQKIFFLNASLKSAEIPWAEKQALLQSFLSTNEDFLVVSIVNEKGDELIKALNNNAATEDDRLLNRAEEGVFQKSKTGESQISRLYFIKERPCLSLVYPFEKNYYLYIITEFSQLWTKIAGTKLGAQGYAFVVDDSGNIISHPQKERALKKEPAKDLAIVQSVLKAVSVGSSEYVDKNGQSLVAAYAPVKTLKWGVVIQQPKEEAYATAIRMRHDAKIWSQKMLFFALGIIFFSIILASAIAFYLASNLTRPILELTRVAQGVAANPPNFSLRANVYTHDELKKLADTFNQMIERLQTYAAMQIDRIIAERNKTEAIIFSIADGIILTDHLGKIMLCNEQAKNMLGLKKDISEGVSLLDYLSEGKIRPLIAEIIQNPQQNIARELDLSEADYLKIFQVNAHPVKSRQGEELGVVTVLHNITLEKEMDQLKDDFVHTITHDLRNPLTSIHGFLQFFLDGSAGPVNKQQNDFLLIMDRSCNRLLSMVSDILDVAKIEAGKTLSLNLEECDLAALVKKVFDYQFPLAKKKQIALETIVSTNNFPKLKADIQLLERVIANLVGNSLKFTPSAGRITIELSEQDDRILVNIADTGPGIPPDYLDKVFNKFQQVAGQRKGGTGLGLTICKLIVEAHQGKIWVESELGKGSQFKFLLPKDLKSVE
ncbi:MAG: ATP-binding protein [Elusimicrobiota bacterium]